MYVLFNNHLIIIFINSAFPILSVLFVFFTNNDQLAHHTTRGLRLVEQSIHNEHNAPNYLDLDFLDHQLTNFQKYTTPPLTPSNHSTPENSCQFVKKINLSRFWSQFTPACHQINALPRPNFCRVLARVCEYLSFQDWSRWSSVSQLSIPWTQMLSIPYSGPLPS